MKKGILLLMLFGSVFANGQSLKEALYSGKLKTEHGTVIRKGDDLSTKMDTVRKATTADSAKAKGIALSTDSSAKRLTVKTDSAALTGINLDTTLTIATDTAMVTTEAAPAAKEKAAAPKDNNTLWKEYVNSVLPALKTEALPSKKVKKGNYYVTVSYEIGTDGQASVAEVFVTPENDFLQQQVKERLNVEPPRLQPVLNSTGAPRKVTRKYNFTLTKE